MSLTKLRGSPGPVKWWTLWGSQRQEVWWFATLLLSAGLATCGAPAAPTGPERPHRIIGGVVEPLYYPLGGACAHAVWSPNYVWISGPPNSLEFRCYLTVCVLVCVW